MKKTLATIDLSNVNLTVQELHTKIGEAIEKGATNIEIPFRKGIPLVVSFVRNATQEEESKSVLKSLTTDQVEAIKLLYNIEIDTNGFRSE